MLTQNDRALKEWAVACEAMKTGEQIVLIRKGGIREEDGVFRVDGPEFFLMPTYEHQNADLLRPPFVERLQEIDARGHDPRRVTVDTYAVVDTVAVADDEQTVRMLAPEHIWNDEYVRMRFDYNPYDPLYVILLRVYRLPEAASLPMRPDYAGCKSWVTMDRKLSTDGALPAISDGDFRARRAALLSCLHRD